MKLSFAIRKLVAGFLLLLFVFGNTPQKILHDVFAGHTDVAYKSNGKHTDAQLTKAGYSCDYHNYVAESPFTNSADCTQNLPVFFQQENKTASRQFVSSFISHLFQLRAPPVSC
ncbi:MAG: hypothetical protein QM725_10225 [Lacibacter sp.]